MNWRTKARIQNLVARLPLAEPIYYALQRRLGRLRPGSHDPSDWFGAAAATVQWARAAGTTVEGKRILEIGTGRRLDIPTALWLCGARETVTVDLNRYLSASLVEETIDWTRRNDAALAAIFGDDARHPRFQERLAALRAFSGDLADYQALIGAQYHAPMDATRLPFAAGSFDFHVSHTVLQHIPSDVLLALLAEARRVLRPQGLLVHFIDLSDMFSHDDPSICAVNFLRYSQEEWERATGNRFAYQSRLRVHEYLKIFADAGVKIIEKAERVDERSLELLRDGRLALDARFRAVDPELLAVRHLRFLGAFH